MPDMDFPEILKQIRKIKLEQLELQKQEHMLFNQLLQKLDTNFLDTISDMVIGSDVNT